MLVLQAFFLALVLPNESRHNAKAGMQKILVVDDDSHERNGLFPEREQSLVQLVAEGRTNRDISQELRLRVCTVRNYLFRIFNKLELSTRPELGLNAISQRDSDLNGDSPRNESLTPAIS